MEALWGDLDDDDIDLSEWYEPILKDRIEALESGEQECIPLAVLKQRKLNG